MSGKDAFKVGVTHTILERERMVLSATTAAELLKSRAMLPVFLANGIWGMQMNFNHRIAALMKSSFTATVELVSDILVLVQMLQNKYFNPVIKHNGSFVQTEGFCTDA